MFLPQYCVPSISQTSVLTHEHTAKIIPNTQPTLQENRTQRYPTIGPLLAFLGRGESRRESAQLLCSVSQALVGFHTGMVLEPIPLWILRILVLSSEPTHIHNNLSGMKVGGRNSLLRVSLAK